MSISRNTRSDILDYLLLSERPFYGNLGLMPFLQKVWDLSSMRSTDRRFTTALKDIDHHYFKFQDWTLNELLYNRLEILGCSDEIFIKFIENCLSPTVVSDEEQINEMLSVFNLALSNDGYQVIPGGQWAGKQIYKVIKSDILPLETRHQIAQGSILAQSTYQSILQIIHDTGKAFERLPSTYSNKGEEDLRDHLLLALTPHFSRRGSVTGETFNKSGDTDILIQEQNTTLFIAECKIWNGSEEYKKAIAQLFRYINWRDTKAALIIFVKNKEISSVIDAVKKTTPQHPNYISFVNEQDVSWLNYRFHINGDPNIEVKLAVMLYHIPSEHKGREKQIVQVNQEDLKRESQRNVESIFEQHLKAKQQEAPRFDLRISIRHEFELQSPHDQALLIDVMNIGSASSYIDGSSIKFCFLFNGKQEEAGYLLDNNPLMDMNSGSGITLEPGRKYTYILPTVYFEALKKYIGRQFNSDERIIPVEIRIVDDIGNTYQDRLEEDQKDMILKWMYS